jgi:hypothetical protein
METLPMDPVIPSSVLLRRLSNFGRAGNGRLRKERLGASEGDRCSNRGLPTARLRPS